MDDREATHGPPPREAPEKVARAKEFCEGLFARHGGARWPWQVRETPEAIGVSLTAGDGNGVELTGGLVEAVQYLVNRVVNPRAEGRKWVNLDVGGFPRGGRPGRAGHGGAARRGGAAHRARCSRSPPSARGSAARIHLALVGVDGVSTRSEGEGLFRQLLVVPGTKPRPRRGLSARGPREDPGRRSSSPRRCCGGPSSSRATSTARASGSSTRACCATWASRTRTSRPSSRRTRPRSRPRSGGAGRSGAAGARARGPGLRRGLAARRPARSGFRWARPELAAARALRRPAARAGTGR